MKFAGSWYGDVSLICDETANAFSQAFSETKLFELLLQYNSRSLMLREYGGMLTEGFWETEIAVMAALEITDIAYPSTQPPASPPPRASSWEGLGQILWARPGLGKKDFFCMVGQYISNIILRLSQNYS